MRIARICLPVVHFCAFLLVGPAVIAQNSARIVHVFVALADNQHQGIVPVPARLGNGQDPANNLYWGASFGVRSFFKASSEWRLLSCQSNPRPSVLERCIFHRDNPEVILVADAYDGAQIRDAVSEFLASAAGLRQETLSLTLNNQQSTFGIAGAADLLVYVGHDALMDFQIPRILGKIGSHPRRFMVLACASKPYFQTYMRDTKSEPLLWTTGLMAPEAYTLKAALDGWARAESDESIRQRAAGAYDKYQKCGLRAALRLFSSVW